MLGLAPLGLNPLGLDMARAAAAVGAFLARFGPIILQAVNRASTY